MPAAPVLVVSHDAQDYLPLLRRALGGEAPIAAASSAAEAASRYEGQPVLLGRPDMLAPLLATRPPVAWVQSTWAGVRPLAELDFRGYRLTGVKDVFGPQMAAYVFAHVLAREIRLDDERWESERTGYWDDAPSGALDGKVMGIMGTGSIGRHVARVAAGFGLRVIGFNTRGEDLSGFERVHTRAALDGFLAGSDYVVGILPDVLGTTDLLDAAAFARMKSAALLINVGRGNLIDESALADALAAGAIAGAVLDVLRVEPLPSDSPLWTAPNLTITGHVAAVSRPADIVRVFAANYRRFVEGGELEYVIDPGRGY